MSSSELIELCNIGFEFLLIVKLDMSDRGISIMYSYMRSMIFFVSINLNRLFFYFLILLFFCTDWDSSTDELSSKVESYIVKVRRVRVRE